MSGPHHEGRNACGCSAGGGEVLEPQKSQSSIRSKDTEKRNSGKGGSHGAVQCDHRKPGSRMAEMRGGVLMGQYIQRQICNGRVVGRVLGLELLEGDGMS